MSLVVDIQSSELIRFCFIVQFVQNKESAELQRIASLSFHYPHSHFVQAKVI
jgi:hypothetical protein